MTRRIRRLRWRLARLIAPAPILAAPHAGTAILLREHGSEDVERTVWLHPKTLDIAMKSTVPPFAQDGEYVLYNKLTRTGTITGTI